MSPKTAYFFIIFVVALTLLSGCVCTTPRGGQYTEIRCDPPYIRVADGCCLDKDGNRICDRDETTTTTNLPSTTSTQTNKPATTHPPTTTTIGQTTSTTAQTTACKVNMDCGEQVTYLKCYQGDVVAYTETPICEKPGTPQAKCIKKSKTTIYDKCTSDEKCLNAQCTPVDSITCVDACLDRGYTEWYCDLTPTCSGSDVSASLGDPGCSPGDSDGYCCCKSDSAVEVTSTTVPPMTETNSTTTTNPHPQTHWECVGPSMCARVPGAGLNTCTSNIQCLHYTPSKSTTTTTMKIYHKECTGFNKCTLVPGPGPDQCVTNINCVSFSKTTTTLATHKACVGNACVTVPGPGTNQCTTNIQCITVTSLTIPTTPTIPPDIYGTL